MGGGGILHGRHGAGLVVVAIEGTESGGGGAAEGALGGGRRQHFAGGEDAVEIGGFVRLRRLG